MPDKIIQFQIVSDQEQNNVVWVLTANGRLFIRGSSPNDWHEIGLPEDM